tara:strand:+ start:82 stop:429 length:348 start_codon:yes stop_codon:yes gene_type:complete
MINNTKIKNKIELLSLILVVSFLFIHNIIPVLIGVVLSLYLINLDLISSFTNLIKQNLFKEKGFIELNKNNKLTNTKRNTIKSIEIEDSTLALVQEIEELGFIPSLDKNDESNLA